MCYLTGSARFLFLDLINEETKKEKKTMTYT